MNLSRWDPSRELEEVSGKEAMTVADWIPPVDISETEAEYLIKAELPEVKRAQDFADKEDLFRLLVEGVKDYAIFMIDPKGHVLSWNLGAEIVKGYRADEIIGRSAEIFYTEEAKRNKKFSQLLETAAAKGRVEDENWRVRKDGSLFWANIIITALYDRSGQLRGFATVTRDLSERKRAEEDLRLAHQGLEERVKERTRELQEMNRLLNAKNEELEHSKESLYEKIQELETFHDVVVGREPKMIQLENDIERLKREAGGQHE